MKLRFQPGQAIVVRTLIVGPSGVLNIRLLLDTGATSTLVSPKILDDVGLPLASNEARTSLTTVSGMEYAHRIRVPKLEALGVRREGLRVTAHMLPPSAPVDGLLGLDFLVGLRLTLDLKIGELTVES